MMNYMRCHSLCRAALVAVFLLLAACGRIVEWPEITGRVYDKETGKPMENAFVIAIWRGHWAGTIGGGTTGCMHAEVVRTDKSGRYRIPAWENHSETNRVDDQRVFLYGYAPGHLLGSAFYKQGMLASYGLAMARGSDESDSRMNELIDIMQAAKCFPFDDAEFDYAFNQLSPIWREIFNEACSLRPYQDKDFISGILGFYLSHRFGDRYGLENSRKGCEYDWK